MKKKVWCLYRVSTKSQVNTDDDIPTQRDSCHKFVNQQKDWEITHELYEKGVSAWKKKTDERDALNEIKEGAIKGDMDIVLVWMFDRLGRNENESPMVVDFLHKQNVEAWSVVEGKRSMETHVDKLINYINFWQSSGESLKTSMRARENKKYYSEQGRFQGGVAPYGYKIVETDEMHWKDPDRKVKELIPEENESEVVKIIYDLYTSRNYGYRKIVDYLNSSGYRTRSGDYFRINLVSRILDNPIFIGKKRYKSFNGEEGDTQPYNHKLRIVSDEVFNLVQEMKAKKKGKLNKQDKSEIPKSGKLLFSGIAYCTYCGSKLSGHYLYRKSQKPHNPEEYYTNIIYRYRCPLNNGKVKHNQNLWGAVKYDKIMIERILKTMENVDVQNYIFASNEKRVQRIEQKKENESVLNREINQIQKQIDKLNAEIAKALIGDSSFTPDQLSSAIQTQENKKEEKAKNLERLKSDIEESEKSIDKSSYMSDELVDWRGKFEKANHDTKKAMISRIVNYVELGKNEVTIDFKDDIENAIQYESLKNATGDK